MVQLGSNLDVCLTTSSFSIYHHLHCPSPQLAPNCSHPPLPSPEGCGLAQSCSTGGCSGKNTRGDPASGRPSWCVTLSLTPTNAIEPHLCSNCHDDQPRPTLAVRPS